ncbi:MAG: exosortase-associated protein EpsI, B-type [Methylococcales bacterium]
MNGLMLRPILIGFAMLAAAGLTLALKPTQRVAEQAPSIDLETMIPKQFGDWRMIEEIDRLMVSPDGQAILDRIYNQTLSRTYINSEGERVMLSIAYGSDQSDSLKAHRPEVCYPAQGFQVLKQMRGALQTSFGQISVKHLITEQGRRVEPVTYWFVTGGRVNVNNLERKLAQIRFGLTGEIPDGLLFRVSTIDRDAERAFSVQAGFVDVLLRSLSDPGRIRLLGNTS